ncbi:hypothetical protein QAD02_020430 [Eretmocerus hayati]|uniref:Uncharacterized protein n=1 Tax=Eretmocerus hayati TaxID=131215 RepID=A0ACC2PML3_9HYME|nr:hypothetical protein QAD02_020430 [Eretmocerus hayati]
MPNSGLVERIQPNKHYPACWAGPTDICDAPFMTCLLVCGVSDILSPIEESYRKLELAAAAVGAGIAGHGPGSPYANTCTAVAVGAGVSVTPRGMMSSTPGGANTGSSSASSGSPPLHGGSTPGISTPGPNGCSSGLVASGATMNPMSNPYAMQLAPQYQYCAADLAPYHHASAGVVSGSGAPDSMRSHAVSSHHPWYASASTTTNDPRFASEYSHQASLNNYWRQ